MYRHMFAKLKTTLDDRLAAWANYCALFDHVLDGRDTRTELTAQWVFDILHEFVYQRGAASLLGARRGPLLAEVAPTARDGCSELGA